MVTLGLQEHILTSGEGAAIVTAALGSLALTAAGVTLLGRGRTSETDPDAGPLGAEPGR